MNNKDNNKEYEVINLGYEYPGMKGGIKWAVITELDSEMLLEKYGDELSMFKPFVVMTKAQGEVLKDYDRNEAKHRMRRVRTCSLDGYVEGETEYIYSVFSKDEPEDIVVQMDEVECLRKAVETLTDIQKRRLKLYFYNDLTAREIAELEGVSHKNVLKSLNEAIKKIQKYKN